MHGDSEGGRDAEEAGPTARPAHRSWVSRRRLRLLLRAMRPLVTFFRAGPTLMEVFSRAVVRKAILLPLCGRGHQSPDSENLPGTGTCGCKSPVGCGAAAQVRSGYRFRQGSYLQQQLYHIHVHQAQDRLPIDVRDEVTSA